MFFLSLTPAIASFYDRSVSYNSHISIHCYRRIKNLPYYFIFCFCCCCAQANNTYENIWSIDFILLKFLVCIFFRYLDAVPSVIVSFRSGYLRASVCNKWNKTFKSSEMEFATINCQRNTFWMQMKRKRRPKLNCSICGEGMLLLLLLWRMVCFYCFWKMMNWVDWSHPFNVKWNSHRYSKEAIEYILK